VMSKKVISVGTLGNTKIDIDASSSLPWCDGLYLKPIAGARKKMPKEELETLDIDFKQYRAVLIWHQVIQEPLLTFLKKLVKINPAALIIGNSHGYNKSISELFDLYGLSMPHYFTNYYSMWGPYFTNRYEEIYRSKAQKKNILSLGSLRHDYLFKNFRWDKNKTNGKLLLIHEPETAESWNDPSPIGDNRLSESIIAELDKAKIPFDYKVHPNWPDFISNADAPMWRPPANVDIVNISIEEMLEYEAVVASWSSVQFDAMAMGIPIINIDYDYPAINHSEWGPGKLGLLKPIKPEQIKRVFEKSQYLQPPDRELLNYFLGDLGKVGDHYYEFIKSKLNFSNTASRLFKRKFANSIKHTKNLLRPVKNILTSK
jgi:hypothetical protein